MKRIEMIHLMADHIRESVRKGENLSISAEMLLEKMEEAGMAAPKTMENMFAGKKLAEPKLVRKWDKE